jgi:hypothetical protein
VRVQLRGGDAELRPDEAEPEPVGQSQIALQLGGCLLDGEVAVEQSAAKQTWCEVAR